MATILVVDDDPLIRRLLRLTIGPEHAVDEAADGADALNRLATAQPDIVLLDVAMPFVDGLEVCRTARTRLARTHLGIIILSAYVRQDEALTAGADRCFPKPFHPVELLNAVDELLARQALGTAITSQCRLKFAM